MQTASRIAIAYAINALWILPLLFLAAEITARLLGRARGQVLHRLWLVFLVFALTVPALPMLHMPEHIISSESIHRSLKMPIEVGKSGVIPRSAREKLHMPFSGEQLGRPTQKDQRLGDIPGVISTGVLWLYISSILFALARLAWGLKQTRSLVQTANAAVLGREANASWNCCLKLFGKTHVKLMSSRALNGPATLSWPRPIVLLPAELNDEEASEMSALFCHELAHVCRRDFFWNITIELFGILLFYHPAFHGIRRRIHETRELACDDMAADAMLGRRIYAHNLLRLTQKMLSAAVVPKRGCALGIFEGEVLERRIMNLLENRSNHARLRTFTSVTLGACLVLATCFLGTNFGLKFVNAQSAIQANHAPPGWFMAGSKPANYQTGVDKTVTENGQTSAFLVSSVPVTDGFGTLMQTIRAADYAGKRVRLRVSVRSQDVADWAGVWMRVDKEKTTVAFDNMQNRAVKGTQPWKPYDVVLDVPDDATGISFGVLLSGSGEVWISDVSFEVVGNGVPVTSSDQTDRLPSHPVNLNFTE
jgi:beta-lactamase regulating signal transducer with metallopeptidase domain